ncbi:MarR family transcriptional regulator [Sinorhizobium medicae]|uniref:Transcriptional regulator, MarR family n=1 Tax=Sinorhizobium medicae TaxID=110321 RepID=A0A508XBQ9_9HYPH|nr:MarR family transcriptional regulator [Sinorhizobium medicae]MBO1939645.1 MarR family transcriptional regulator [Sinorhizobium medicae]MDX0423552.1 MarR family transcriptional regulator [Sinorhizobium medicae]MDX0429015.1 MarR family transcriptional regulator [Sinorhizobium medicae]MDX0441116.1 MarR family transcriptional regulator [Sinorhizobium medicae]MDX0458416.1 MarR family transcriptional regulator [Sinorhizobium medicae]
MSETKVSRALFDALATVNRKLRSVFDARVKERGLTLPRARMLFALARKEGLNQRELAEELDIETPTIVRLLDGMENQGFIERRVELSDRRAKQIYMTVSGRALAEEIQKLASDIREEVLGGLRPEEIAGALKVVNTIATNIQSIGRSGGR